MACLPSTCPFCACGCGLLLQEENGRLAASFPSTAPPARSSLCIRGWHCTSPVSAPDRLRTPLVRGAAGLVPASWQEAVSEVAHRLSGARRPALVAVGPTLSSEDSRAVLGLAEATGGRACTSDLTGVVAARRAMEAVAPGARGLADPEAISRADLLWVIGFDAAGAPQVAARVVDARRRGASIVRFDVHLASADGSRVVTLPPEHFGELQLTASLLDEFQAAARPVVIVGGRWLTSADAEANTVALLRSLAPLGALERVVFAVGESNSWGVLDVLGPDAPAAEVAGRDDDLDTVVVAADDLVARSPRPGSMADALSRLTSLIVIDRFPTATTALADVVLPACTFAESDGSVTNLFGQIHSWRRIVSPPGAAVPERIWTQRIVEALGTPTTRTSSTSSARTLSTSSTRTLSTSSTSSARTLSTSSTSSTRTLSTSSTPSTSSTTPFPLSLSLSSHSAAFSTGVLSSRDHVLRREAIEPVLMASPGVLKAAGLKPGWPARLVLPEGEIVLTVRVDRRLPDTVVVLVPLPGSSSLALRGWYPSGDGRAVGLQPVPARLERA